MGDIVIVNEGRLREHAKMAIALENYSSDRSHMITNISGADIRLSCLKEEKSAANPQLGQPIRRLLRQMEGISNDSKKIMQIR